MKALILGMLPFVPGAAPHPADKPLADVTTTVASDGVEMSLLMNFQFLDGALGLTGSADTCPDGDELALVEGRLRDLFRGHHVVCFDGSPVQPEFVSYSTALPPEALRVREPGLSRGLTQVKFDLRYPFEVEPSRLSLTWHWFPEHPIYDVPDSPVAPMTVPWIVVREGVAPAVLELNLKEPSQEVVLGESAPVDALPERAPSPVSKESALTPVLAVAVLLALAGCFWCRKRQAGVAASCFLLVLAGCSGDGVRSTTTANYVVTIRTDPEAIPLNEHFVVDVEIAALDGVVPKEVLVDADMPAHGHGMNTAPRMTRREDGSLRAEGMLFHMPGEWELYVYIGRGAAMERAVFSVTL